MTSNIERLAVMNSALTRSFAPWVRDVVVARCKVDKNVAARQGNREIQDAGASLSAVLGHWNGFFHEVMPRQLRSAASSALDGRNAASHPTLEPTDSETIRALLGAEELLVFVGARDDAALMRGYLDELRDGHGPNPPAAAPTVPPRKPLPNNSDSAAVSEPKQRRRDPTPTSSEDFWVYENWTHKKAIVHRATCSFCNHGRGLHERTTDRNGKWIGPYPTLDAAFKAAKATDQPEVRGCGTCAP